jgi:guanosine-3',5'-bis(diphosphate) 3'-pyrophosphohydrolase
MPGPPLLFPPALGAALRWAATLHHGQARRGSGVPYVQHVVAVAMILDRLGFEEEVVIAGLLHDAVEDTDATLDDVRARFGPTVANLVASCSEVKVDATGQKRPWLDRKRDHLAALADAPVPARAVTLADKLHNLLSIAADLAMGLPVWTLFHADRDSVLWYYRTAVDSLGHGDPRLDTLAFQCRGVLAGIEAGEISGEKSGPFSAG